MKSEAPGRFLSRRAGWAMLFVGLSVVEYWLWPAGDPGWDYAGWWSLLGNALLVVLVAVVWWGAGVPVLRWLKGLRSPPKRWAFAGLWAGGLASWLVAASVLSLADTAAGPLQAGVVFSPVLSPFGLWPSVQFLVPGIWVQGYLSPETFLLFGTITFLWASAALLAHDRLERARRSCILPRNPSKRATFAGLSALGWLPVTGTSACCCCSPLLLVLLGLLPGASGGVAVLSGLAFWLNGPLELIALAMVIVAVYLASPLSSEAPRVGAPA